MQESIRLNTSDTLNNGPAHFERLHLDLNVTDSTTVKYLSQFDEPERTEHALEAIKVGVIAIQSASPTLDTRVVDAKFRELSRELEACVGDFGHHLTQQMEEYFNGGSGSVPRRLESLFGSNGSVSNLFNQYFSIDDSKLKQLLLGQLGPASEFARSLDPNNREGVISRIEAVVSKRMDEKIGGLIEEFSFDSEDSAVARLRKSVTDELLVMQRQLTTLFAELRESMGIEAGKAQEAIRGTEKGREFEVTLYDRVAEIGRTLGDGTENVRGVVGELERCKKGDYLITLGETSGAPELNIVFEAKKNNNCKLKHAIDELEEAKKNRNAVAGIFVYAAGYQPPEVGDFLRVGNDFFVTISEEAVNGEEPAVYLEAAYKIARALAITSSRKSEAQELDLDMLATEIDGIIQQVSRLSEIGTKVKTIRNNSEWIERQVTELQVDLELKLGLMARRIREVN